MTISLDTGEILPNSIDHQSVTALMHGGAGPADPKGENALRAREAFLYIEQEVSGRWQDNHTSNFLKKYWQEASSAEKFCLWGARLLEEEPLLNAGRGAALQQDGKARLSAGFMESRRRKFSGLVNLEEVLCPSEIAYYLQFQEFSILDPQGARNLANDLRIERVNLVTEARREEWRKYRDEEAETRHGKSGTIGVVAVDGGGDLAALTSTGGRGYEVVGRIGDTCTVAGNFCNRQVAVSCTGIGEQIIREAFSAKLGVRVEDGMDFRKAIEKGLREADEKGFEFGAIAVHYDPKTGKRAWAAGTTTKSFLWSAYTPQGWIRTKI